MNELLEILKSEKITLPDDEMNADELLWWIIGYKACMDKVTLIANILKEQSKAGSVDILMGEIYEKDGQTKN